MTTQADIEAGAVEVVAPEGFFNHSIAENLMASTAMSRSASYIYSNLFDANKGMVDGVDIEVMMT